MLYLHMLLLPTFVFTNFFFQEVWYGRVLSLSFFLSTRAGEDMLVCSRQAIPLFPTASSQDLVIVFFTDVTVLLCRWEIHR